MNNKLLSCCCGAALLVAGNAQAADLKWQVFGDLGAAFETNPTKVEEDEKEDTRVRARIGGRLYQDTEQLFLDLEYSAATEAWVNDTFQDRNTLEGYGQILWQPVDFFNLYVNNRRQDLIVNNTFADTQDNRSVRSTTEIGALFIGHITKVDTLNIAPVYRAVRFQDSGGVGSKRPGVLAFWQHRISTTDRFGLNAFVESIDYDSDAVQNDVLRAQAFVSYSARLNRLSYDFQFGQTWMQGDDSNNDPGVDDSDNDFQGTLLRAFIDYDYDNHMFQLRAFHDLTDTSIGLSDSNVGGVGYNPGDSSVSQLALITRTQVDVRYGLAFAARQWDWSIGYRFDKQIVEARADEEGFQAPARDEIRNRIYSTLHYNMTRYVDARLEGEYYSIDFTDSPIGRVDDYLRVGLIFDFQLFRYGRLRAGAVHEQRLSNAEPLVHDYTDETLFVDFRLEFPPLARRGVRGFRGNTSRTGGGSSF